ncbi:MAG: hypothetical protein VCC36_04735 [Gammaproteobacteria bacterium]|jgi:hypothetical protein
MGISGHAPKLDTVDDESTSGLHEILDLLDATPAAASLLDDQTLLEILNFKDEATPPDEYVLGPSALNEKRSLEELSDLATGSHKREALDADTTDTSDCYFHFTRRFKALRQDQADLEEIKSSPAVKRT